MLIHGVKLEHFEAGNIFIVPDSSFDDSQVGQKFDLIISPALNEQERFFKSKLLNLMLEQPDIQWFVPQLVMLAERWLNLPYSEAKGFIVNVLPKFPWLKECGYDKVVFKPIQYY